MYNILVFLTLALGLYFGYSPEALATGGGTGTGGTTSGSSVPFLHIIGQLAFIVVIAIWYRNKK